MRRCIRSGKMLAFSLGLIAGLVLPGSWIAVVAAVLLVVISFVMRGRGRCF